MRADLPLSVLLLFVCLLQQVTSQWQQHSQWPPVADESQNEFWGSADAEQALDSPQRSFDRPSQPIGNVGRQSPRVGQGAISRDQPATSGGLQSPAARKLTIASAPIDMIQGNDSWRHEAIQKMWEERKRMQHTPIVIITAPGYPSVEFIFKNESATASGSLKHRYAWALIMWALVEGHVGPRTTVYEASSGNTAAGEAFMCRLIGVDFAAVVPDTIEDIKAQHIQEFGGSLIKVDIGKRIETAAAVAQQNRGFFMNQFANSDKAEEFHESGEYELESVNVLHEIVYQLKALTGNRDVAPDYFVHSAGTGGTISSVGRYAKKYNLKTQTVLADTEFSVYFDYVMFGKFKNESGASLWVKPGMAGTGYGPLGAAIKGATTSLTSAVIDRVIKVPDLGSTAAMHFLRTLGINGGTSTGVNFLAALSIAAKEQSKKVFRSEPVRISLLLADNGSNYDSTYYNRTYIGQNFAPHGGLRNFDCWYRVIEHAYNNGGDPIAQGAAMCPSPLQKQPTRRF